MLDSEFLPILVPCLRIVGNVSTGNAVQTQELIKYNAINKLEALLNHNKKVVRREACWVLSNIAAGDNAQVLFD
jgi:importin subunit alpha-6/7